MLAITTPDSVRSHVGLVSHSRSRKTTPLLRRRGSFCAHAESRPEEEFAKVNSPLLGRLTGLERRGKDVFRFGRKGLVVTRACGYWRMLTSLPVPRGRTTDRNSDSCMPY